MSESNERGGFSFQLSETPPPSKLEEQAPLGDLVLDLQDFGTWEEPAPSLAEEPLVISPLPAPVAEAQVASMPVAKASAAQVKEAPLAQVDEAPVQNAPAAQVKEALAKPRIKKIQFPLKKTAVSAESATLEKPKTRFSDSISAPAVAVRLDDGDSEPPPRMNGAPGGDELDFPDDLPSFNSTESQRADEAWGSETPSAKEIWNSARRTWKATTQKASVLGGMSLRAGQKAAQGLNARIKEHREFASKEREARAALDATSQTSPAALEDRAVLGDVPEAPAARPAASSSVNRRRLKKIVAPLSAAAAATLVYLVGTQLLGTHATVSLSSATHAPEIPDLGSLKNETAPNESTSDKSASEVRDRRGAATEKSTDPDSEPGAVGEMRVEVAPMPDGLSWPGKGLIEVVTSEEELIYVDSVFTGRGPLRRIPVSPGEHEVSIRTGGTKRSGIVQVEVNKNTRAVFKGE